MENNLSIKHLSKMRRTANVGLYGSIAVAAAVIIFYYASHYRFYLEQSAARNLMLGGCALAVIVVASALLTINRKPRRLRQMDSVNGRVSAYASMMASLYTIVFITNAMLSAIILLCHDNTLLMFILISVLLLVLSYPNMYKVKVDLGLTHEQMCDLYGDTYRNAEKPMEGTIVSAPDETPIEESENDKAE